MKALLHKPLTVALLLAVFAVSVLFSASPAEAQYHSKSDELPGLVDLTPLLIVGGVLVGGMIIYSIAKHNSKDAGEETMLSPQTAEDSESEDSATDGAEADTETDEATALLVAPEQESRLGIFFDVKDDRTLYGSKKPALDFSDLTVTAGITIGF